MRTGQSLQDIATALQHQIATRKDYIAPQGVLEAEVVDGVIQVKGLNGDRFGITGHAHGQLSSHLGIPKGYYDRMLVEQPQLLTANVNGWLQKDPENKRMVRTLDGRVRAFLSPKFRPLDNFDLATVVLPKLMKMGAQIMSSELTETRLYLKAILPALSSPLPEGMQWGHGHRSVGRDGNIVAAIVISNSDVGAGTLRVEPSVFTTWCTNLAVMAESAMRKYHVGRAFEADANWNVFTDTTRAADDKAFWLKVGDVTDAAFSEDVFKAAIAQIGQATKVEIASKDLPKVVDMTVKQLALPTSTTSSILTHLAAGGDLTQWGLSSAITATANDFETYEGATELERAGGLVLALKPSEWEVISKAA